MLLLIGFLYLLLIFCAVAWCAKMIMKAFSVGDPIETLVYVGLVLLFLVWLINGPHVAIPYYKVG